MAVSILVRLAGCICAYAFFSYMLSPVDALYSPAYGAEILYWSVCVVAIVTDKVSARVCAMVVCNSVVVCVVA